MYEELREELYDYYNQNPVITDSEVIDEKFELKEDGYYVFDGDYPLIYSKRDTEMFQEKLENAYQKLDKDLEVLIIEYGEEVNWYTYEGE